MRVLLYRLLAFRVPQHCFQEDLLYDLPRHRGETDRPVAPGVFLPFVKMGVILPFFHSPGTPPDCHDFSDVTESDLETTSANSLRTLWKIWFPWASSIIPKRVGGEALSFFIQIRKAYPRGVSPRMGFCRIPFILPSVRIVPSFFPRWLKYVEVADFPVPRRFPLVCNLSGLHSTSTVRKSNLSTDFCN